AWRQEFERRAAGKGLQTLIAGYGIRWNIKYESRRRAYEARDVIDEMLRAEYVKFQEKIARASRKDNCKKYGHFNEIQFAKKEWLLIAQLNDELEPFDRLTKMMEGDGPTGPYVLPNYFQTISDLKNKDEQCGRDDALHPMYIKMIEKLKVYEDEALGCETLVMATLLHPSFWLKLLSKCWPEKSGEAQVSLERHFAAREALLKRESDDIEVLDEDKEKPKEVVNKNIFDEFNSTAAAAESKELELYLKNMDCFAAPNSKDPVSALIWWK
ncbi:hypothetical protein PTTG_30514, partial [Puccinia triticina 1-1 BBBD Race 1]